ncbi:Telomerase reverse transcriptase [Coemansia sp. RSA 485]|nr:Telomerase reverse transcriptase [Coemansia sp. RSA 485]KAJ2599437.1 Telomerase reverse transcriptase [Coemansia sp. RSA 1721]
MNALSFKDYYPVVSALGVYFDALLDNKDVCVRPGDPAGFRRFVKTTIVGHSPIIKTCAREEPTHSVRDTAIDAICQLLRTPAKDIGSGPKYGESRCENVFADGYTAKKDGSKNTVPGDSSLLNRHINSSTVELNKKRWKTLLDRVGNTALKRLLTETSIFIPLKNKNYHQVSGMPFVSLKRPPPGQLDVPQIQNIVGSVSSLKCESACRASKRVREQHDASTSAEEQDHPKRICASKACSGDAQRAVTETRFQAPDKPCPLVVSSKMLMYCVPRMSKGRKKTGRSISWEMPQTFVLSRCCTPDQLLRRIFAETIDFDTEMPPRLAALASRMLKLHQGFNYRLHLFEKCPAPWQNGAQSEDCACSPGADPKDAEQPSPALSSDAHRCKRSGNRLESESESESNSILGPESAGLQQMPADAAPCVLQMASARSSVYLFLQLCIQRVIPRELIGGQKNHRGLYKLIRRLISAGCFEQLWLHEAIPWFMSTEVSSWLGSFVPQRAFEIYSRLIYWVLTDYIIELVRHFFYVTESSSTQYVMHFYRKDVWINITKEPWNELVKNMYDAKSFDDLVGNGGYKRGSEFHRIRLLPKERSFRAIVNMKRAYVFRRKTASGTGSSKRTDKTQYKKFSTTETSRQLGNVLAAMRCLRQNSPGIVGSSVFSTGDMYAKMQAFKQLEQVKPLLGKQRFYMAKCDIQSAFDTIDQDKLMEILRSRVFLDSRLYVLYKYWTVSLTSDMSKRYAQRAVPADEAMSFGALLSKMAQQARQTVFGDWSETHMLSTDEMLNVVERATKQSVIRSSMGFFRQRTGIPQGSVLSTMLCNIYYAQMEHDHLAAVIDPSRTMMMRLVDDFFVVSTSREQVERLLECMVQGIPEYGCRLNKEKTLVNFDAVIKGHSINRTTQHGVPWCGKLICDRTLDVMIDFGTFVHMPRIDQGLRINTSKLGGYCQLRQRMLKAVRPRMIRLFMDCSFNSEHTVALNLYQHLHICAKKMHVYHRRICVRSTPAQLFKTISDVIMLVHVMLRSNCGKTTLSAADVTWLGMHAFYKALQPKQSRYVLLLERIKSTMDQPRFVRFDRKFESVVASPLNDNVHAVIY